MTTRQCVWLITCVLPSLGPSIGCGFPAAPGLDQVDETIEATVPVVWTSQVNTSVTGDVITKTGGQPFEEDAGAVSSQTVASGDAAMQYTLDETNRFRFVGFAHTTDWHAANMDYSFRMQAGHADVYEHDTWKADIPVAVGDVMKIDVVGGVAHYYKNGVLQYASAQAPAYALRITTSIIDSRSAIASAKISAPPPSGNAVTWVNQVNTSVAGTAITSRGASDPWLSFGAASWEPSSANGGYTGTWHDHDDGIDGRTQVWANLQVVDACGSSGSC